MTNAQTVAALEMALAVFSDLKKELLATREAHDLVQAQLSTVSQEFVAYVVATTAQQQDVQRIADALRALCAEHAQGGG